MLSERSENLLENQNKVIAYLNKIIWFFDFSFFQQKNHISTELD